MLPGFDAEIAEELRRAFLKRGVDGAAGPRLQVDGAQTAVDGRVALDAAGSRKTVDAEVVLVAVGRTPAQRRRWVWTRSASKLDRGGFIKIDDSFRTPARASMRSAT